MIKNCLYYFLFCCCSFTMNAQQTGIYSHEFYKSMTYNPAFTGNNQTMNAMIISRSQWINFKNAPQQNLFIMDGILSNKKMGLGIDLFTDKRGISNKIGGNIYYSYGIKFNENARLNFGIALGLMDHTLHYSEAVIQDSSDPFIIGVSQKETSVNGNVGLGFIWKKLEVGVAVPQLFGSALEYQDNVSGKAYYSLARHYIGSIKYQLTLSKEKQISLTPLAIIHFIQNTPLQYNANLNLEWKNKFWIGATYKSDYAVSANAGFCISKRLSVGYSYDIIIGRIGKYSGMSHEFMLNFLFAKAREEKVEADPETTSFDKQKLDSLQNELEIKDIKIRKELDKVNDLNEELEKLKTENGNLKKISFQTTNPVENNTNQNFSTIAANADKTMEHGVWIMSSTKTEYNYLNKKPALKGFYVITGTFFYRDFAESELQKFRSKNYSSADILYSSGNEFHYVFISFYSEKAEALKNVAKIRSQGVKDAWILSVKD